MTVFDKFLDEYNVVYANTELSDEESICDLAYYANAYCECTSEGSNAYFDTTMSQWYPGEDPEFEVFGYNYYVSDIADTVVGVIVNYYHVIADANLVNSVRENLQYIFQDHFLSEADFEERAIEDYCATVYEDKVF